MSQDWKQVAIELFLCCRWQQSYWGGTCAFCHVSKVL